MAEVPKYRDIQGENIVLRMHPGQYRVWESAKRFPMMLAGTQSGKTCFGVDWLHREITKCGEGDYLVVTATFPLLNLKLLPEFLEVFQTILKLGEYKDSVKTFYFHSDKTKVIFASATNPEGIESATVKGAWLDEAGQKQFRRDSWEAIRRRLSIHQGRALFTTTLYGLGWLKTEFYDKWLNGDPDIEVVQFDSTENPAFPKEEYEKARRTMPGWKFDLFYRGRYSKPAGIIYDCFNEKDSVVERFAIPKEWFRYQGVDFGPIHTAAIWYAQDPTTGYLYAYREYKTATKADISEHAHQFMELSKDEKMMKSVGGSHQESGWRDGFSLAGWSISEPFIKDVEVGLDRVYAFHKLKRIYVFNDLHQYLDEKLSYSRELNDKYEPTDKIENKDTFHLMDAERYIISDFTPVDVKQNNLVHVQYI